MFKNIALNYTAHKMVKLFQLNLHNFNKYVNVLLHILYI